MADFALNVMHDALIIGGFVVASKVIARMRGERFGYYREDVDG